MTMSFKKLRMCLRIGKRSLTGGVVRGSSIDRKDRSLKRPRLKGALRGKTIGDRGSPVWDWRLSEEPMAPWELMLLEGPASTDAENACSSVRSLWPAPAASAPSGVWDIEGEGLGWKSPSVVETDRRRGAAQAPSSGLEGSCSGGAEAPPLGLNRKRNKLLLMQISAVERVKRESENAAPLLKKKSLFIASIFTKWLHRNLILTSVFFFHSIHFTHKVALFHLQLPKQFKREVNKNNYYVILKPKIISHNYHPCSDAICEAVNLHNVLTETALTVFSN